MKDMLDDGAEGGMRLVPLVGSADGVPVLAVPNGEEVVPLVPLPEGMRSGFAVTRPFGRGRHAVLGYFDGGAIAEAAGLRVAGDWLELRHGRANVRLHRDGRVRIGGEDVLLEATGRIALDGAEIDLN